MKLTLGSPKGIGRTPSASAHAYGAMLRRSKCLAHGARDETPAAGAAGVERRQGGRLGECQLSSLSRANFAAAISPRLMPAASAGGEAGAGRELVVGGAAGDRAAGHGHVAALDRLLLVAAAPRG